VACTPERTAQRRLPTSGAVDPEVGDLQLSIPKLRSGSFFLSLLERRRRVDQACSRW
jgi:putative transposase